MKLFRLILLCPVFVVLIVLALGFGESSVAQSCYSVDFMSVSGPGSGQKCTTFAECQVSSPPKYFLTSTKDTSKSVTVSGVNPPDPPWSDSASVATHIVTVIYPTNNCFETNILESGTCADGTESATLGWVCNDDGCFWGWEPENGMPGSIGFLEPCVGIVAGSGNAIYSGQCTSTVTMTNMTGSVTFTDGDTNGTYTVNNSIITITMSSEFTDALLGQIIQNSIILPPYPTNWGEGSSTAATTFTLDTPHVNGSETKVQYRLKIPPCSLKNATYHCEWQEITIDPNGNQLPPATKRGDVIGTGDPINPALGPIQEVPIPQPFYTIYESDPVIVKVDPPPTPPGTGDNN